MAITDGEHVDGAIEKIKSLASDGTEKEHELNATYFHGKELSSFITAEGGGQHRWRHLFQLCVWHMDNLCV